MSLHLLHASELDDELVRVVFDERDARPVFPYARREKFTGM